MLLLFDNDPVSLRFPSSFSLVSLCSLHPLLLALTPLALCSVFDCFPFFLICSFSWAWIHSSQLLPSLSKQLQRRKPSRRALPVRKNMSEKSGPTHIFIVPRLFAYRRNPKFPQFTFQDPKVPRRPNRVDKYSIIKHPLTTESAMKKIEDTNTLTLSLMFVPTKRWSRKQFKSSIR